MPAAYPIHFSAQLRQHLRALRKKHGLTQAQVGALIGVSQARIAEIEANPGLVSLEQMLQLLAALGVTLTLQEEPAAAPAPARPEAAQPAGRKAQRKQGAANPAADYGVNLPPGQSGAYPAYRTRQADEPGQSSAPGTAAQPEPGYRPPEAAAIPDEPPRAPEPAGDPAARRNFVIRPKKGSW